MKRRSGRLLAGILGTVLAATVAPTVAAADDPLPWMNTTLSPEQRADLLVDAMTLDQKVAQLHGQSGPIPEVPECGNGGRHVPGIAALKIPTFRITNGPVGLGGGDCSPQDKATALPVALGLAASFDPALANSFGDLIGDEARTLGLQELEGPGMDLARVGQGGRNFEYLGEDPYLAGAMAASEIKGIQNDGVIAMAKHYVLNDQEFNRMTVSVQVDDRTLHEIYLPPFEASVKDGGVGSVMCSYNRIGTSYACDDPYTLDTVLRGQWGFQGYVQSDFGATHSTATSLNAGEDFEMPSPSFYTTANIQAALSNGTLTEATIDTALKRRYTQMFRFGIFDRPITHGTIDAQADGSTARQIAEQTAVLLKNDGSLLPLDASKVHSIALIGQQTFAGAAAAGGGGSSRVSPLYTVNPLQGLQNTLTELGSTATVNQVIVANNNSNLADAVAAAASADVVVLMAGVVTSEGSDRPSLSLPNNQDALISAVAAANPKTALVLKDGDPVLMPWIGQVPAVLEAWNPGEEDGNAVAQLLFGLANPSGKLPVSYPRAAADTPTSTPDRYPGVDTNGDGIPEVYYGEGLRVGYRWYDAQNIEPLFPFGYGLSYTSFQFSNLQATPVLNPDNTIQAQVDVTNTGSRAGAEVAQVYVADPASTGEPPKQLKGFQKVALNPGETKHLTFTLDQRAFSTWDSTAQEWTTNDGQYQVMVGDSSRNLPLHAGVAVNHTLGTQSVQVSTPSIVDGGSSATVTTTFANTGDFSATNVHLGLRAPAGWTVAANGPTVVPDVRPHTTAQVTWRVDAPTDAHPGNAALTATASFEGPRTGTVTGTANVSVPYPTLSAAFDNRGITDDADPGKGGMAASGNAYSAQALATVGISPGPLGYAATTFTWPAGVGVPDNVEANGQVIAVQGSGGTLAFLGASVSGTQGGRGTVYYTDGSTSGFTLSLSDWWHPATGDQVVATAPYINGPTGRLNQTGSVYYAAVPLDAGKTVHAIRLPVTGASPGPGLHVFAVAIS